MTFLTVHDGTAPRLITGPPGGESYSTDADIPRSVGDVQRSADEFMNWDDDWIIPTYTNGWVTHGGGYSHARYRRIMGGMIRIEGLVTGGSAGNAVMFYLLDGYRPSASMIFAGYCASGTLRLQITSSGAVYYPYSTSTSWHSVECTFHVG